MTLSSVAVYHFDTIRQVCVTPVCAETTDLSISTRFMRIKKAMRSFNLTSCQSPFISTTGQLVCFNVWHLSDVLMICSMYLYCSSLDTATSTACCLCAVNHGPLRVWVWVASHPLSFSAHAGHQFSSLCSSFFQLRVINKQAVSKFCSRPGRIPIRLLPRFYESNSEFMGKM